MFTLLWLPSLRRTSKSRNSNPWGEKKKALYLSVNVLAQKYWLGTLFLTSPTGDGTAILHGHPSHVKVYQFAGQRQYLHFSVILRSWVLVRPWESNPQPPALQSNALLTELILPRVGFRTFPIWQCPNSSILWEFNMAITLQTHQSTQKMPVMHTSRICFYLCGIWQHPKPRLLLRFQVAGYKKWAGGELNRARKFFWFYFPFVSYKSSQGLYSW